MQNEWMSYNVIWKTCNYFVNSNKFYINNFHQLHSLLIVFKFTKVEIKYIILKQNKLEKCKKKKSELINIYEQIMKREKTDSVWAC